MVVKHLNKIKQLQFTTFTKEFANGVSFAGTWWIVNYGDLGVMASTADVWRISAEKSIAGVLGGSGPRHLSQVFGTSDAAYLSQALEESELWHLSRAPEAVTRHLPPGTS